MEKTSKVNNFTEGPILGPLLKFTLPVLAALVVQSLYGAVDLLIVGRFSTTISVSGVSLGSQLTNGVTMVITGFAMSTTVILGQYIGEKKLKDAGKVVGNSIWFFATVAVLVMILLFIFAAPALQIFRIPNEALGEGTIYTKICSVGYIFIISYNLIGAIFRGIGDSKTPLITVSIACVVNIIGDLLLVAVFDMAAAGAAIATVFAQAVSVVVSLLIIKKKGLPFEFGKSSMKFDFSIIKRIIKLGTPLALQEVVVTVSFLVVSAVINTLGLAASAAIGVGGKLTSFIMLFPSAYMQSMSAFVAQNIGAKRIDRAKKALIHGIWTSLAFAFAMSFLSVFHGEWLTQIFSKDPVVIQGAAEYLKAFGIDTFFTSILFCFIGFLNGSGKTTVNMIQGFLGVAIRTPAAFILKALAPDNLFVIGLSTPIATLFQSALCIVYFFLVRKKLEALYGGGLDLDAEESVPLSEEGQITYTE